MDWPFLRWEFPYYCNHSGTLPVWIFWLLCCLPPVTWQSDLNQFFFMEKFMRLFLGRSELKWETSSSLVAKAENESSSQNDVWRFSLAPPFITNVFLGTLLLCLFYGIVQINIRLGFDPYNFCPCKTSQLPCSPPESWKGRQSRELKKWNVAV